MNQKLINLTPHVINIYDADDKTLLMTLEPSGQIARVSMTRIQTGTVAGIPVFASVAGNISGIPQRQDGEENISVGYVVSAITRLALSASKDLFSPGELIRDENGQPIGCKGLDGN